MSKVRSRSKPDIEEKKILLDSTRKNSTGAPGKKPESFQILSGIKNKFTFKGAQKPKPEKQVYSLPATSLMLQKTKLQSPNPLSSPAPSSQPNNKDKDLQTA